VREGLAGIDEAEHKAIVRIRDSRSRLSGLSLVMLLVGRGFGPPLLGIVIGLGAIHGNNREPGRVGRVLATYWAWLLGVTVAAYLALMPGTVLLSALADFENTLLASVLPLIAFGGAVLALIPGRARDHDPSD
jgi:hypothetical protein